MRRFSGFTLIELLIVVAIIAILAAIAIPNFIEAQVRSKVSRAKADMRSLANAIEAYRVDWPTYPPDQQYYVWVAGYSVAHKNAVLMLQVCTTPVSYITSVPLDPFVSKWPTPTSDYPQYGWSSEQTVLLNAQGFLGDLTAKYGPPQAIWSLVRSMEARESPKALLP